MIDSLPFLLAIFGVALLYASVGHGGASGYLAVMALFSVSPEWLRPSALTLNLLVSAIGTVAFYRAGHFRSRLFWPLGLSAVPFAFVGGSVSIPDAAFRWLLALALTVAIARLFMRNPAEDAFRVPSLKTLLPCGAVMGLVSGLIGVGGGIFLTPLVIVMRWAPAKTAAAISAPFIFVNSLAGLLGLRPAVGDLHPLLPWMALAVLFAGFLGAAWGSRIASSRQVRYALAGVLALAVGKLAFT
mgnify:CR=1 FL=1